MKLIKKNKAKLLVFLHGFGFDKNNNSDSIQQLCKGLGVDLFSFDALFDSQRDRGGYARFDIDKQTKKSIINDKFYQSASYIIEQINIELEKRNLERDNVILCGRSQGAFMSIYVGLTYFKQCHSIISLCGFVVEGVNISIKTRPPIIWLNSLNDSVISVDRQQTYKLLEKESVKIINVFDKKGDHDNISKEAIMMIERKFI